MSSTRIRHIIILGAGNLAYHLSKAFRKEGLIIDQIYARDADDAANLARQLDVSWCSDINKIKNNADAYFFCLTDKGIAEILAKTSFTDQLLIHLSGSIEMEVFKGKSSNYGVFYPLQTFSKDRELSFRNIPICLEANSPETLKLLEELAYKLSDDVRAIDSAQRAILHIAAVFACNFSNYLFMIAENILKENNIDFKIIAPLIQETAKKAIDIIPSEAQTGPAKRKDIHIINNHLEVLKKYPQYQEIYRLLTERIQDHYTI